MRTFERLAVTAGGLGLLRPAPGTWGSLPPVVVALGLVASGAPTWQIETALVLLCVLGSVACLRFGDHAEELFGKKDPGSVVADEVAGQAIALLGLPWRTDDLGRSALVGAIAFLAFRLFDIVKPPPARGLQRLQGGLGILVDDLIAGGYALLATQLVTRLLLP